MKKNKHIRYKAVVLCSMFLLCSSVLLSGCEKRQDAYNNDKMNSNKDLNNSQEEEQWTVSEKPTESIADGEDVQDSKEISDGEENASNEEAVTEAAGSNIEKDKLANPNAIIKENSIYDCDIKADREAYDGHVDITVGDKFFATQINDWYITFDAYEGKVVEIEGYYIGDFAPYDFVGRYGPSCPYCQGGYVSFEILSDEDLTAYKSAKDWIKVTGILRQGTDYDQKQPFYYIEALKIEKMDEVGKDTVTD